VAEQLLWSVMVRAVGGPQVAVSASLQVEAYDKLAVTIADGATTQVDLAPSGGEVALVLISASSPSPDLTYEVAGNTVALNGPLALIGSGAVGLLGGATSLSFTNGTGADADIQILVGRDATP